MHTAKALLNLTVHCTAILRDRVSIVTFLARVLRTVSAGVAALAEADDFDAVLGILPLRSNRNFDGSIAIDIAQGIHSSTVAA